MTEYSRSARGSFTTAASPIAQIIYLPFQPTHVNLTNYTTYSDPAQYSVTTAQWDIAMGQGVAEMEYLSADSFPWTVAADYVASAGITTFAAGQMLQYGPTLQISGISKASQAVVTTTSAHGYSVGTTVIMQGIAVAAPTNPMILLNAVPFTIVAVTSTTFTINWNTSGSNYTAISGSPAGALVKQVLYPFLYLPEDNVISGITLGSTTTIKTTMYHNFVVGQEVAFRVPSFWGTTGLNSLPNSLIPGSPMYGYVVSITDNWTFVVNINSSSFGAFPTNPGGSGNPIAIAGLTYAQTLAVGDVNTGGWPISAGSQLYPSPSFPTATGGVPTINGPAIQGAFVNNTNQGFVIGLGVGAAAAAESDSAPLLTASSLYTWEAFFYDIG